jgi:hypothetical protein
LIPLKTEARSGSTGVWGAAPSSSERVCTTAIVAALPDALFSLIVCTRGRTEESDRFLLSVINQSGDIRCEIIVVDQNTDGRLDPKRPVSRPEQEAQARGSNCEGCGSILTLASRPVGNYDKAEDAPVFDRSPESCDVHKKVDAPISARSRCRNRGVCLRSYLHAYHLPQAPPP